MNFISTQTDITKTIPVVIYRLDLIKPIFCKLLLRNVHSGSPHRNVPLAIHPYQRMGHLFHLLDLCSEFCSFFSNSKHSVLSKRGKSYTNLSRCLFPTHEPIPALPVMIQLKGPRSCSSGSRIGKVSNKTTSSTII